jgi:transketolase
MSNEDFDSVKSSKLALTARALIVEMHSRAKSSHVGSALSVVDILAVIYSGGSNICLEMKDKSDRDIIILSKGHATSALYAILATKQFFPKDWLQRYYSDGAELGGHATSWGVPGIELSTGSLGHGLPYGLGIQLSRKIDGIAGQTIVIISDGECNEGTTWESALIASHHNLKNLTVIIDKNGLQGLGFTEDILNLGSLEEKFRTFGWYVLSIDGHNHAEIFKSLKDNSSDKPKCIIANTVKGKGVSFMENQIAWHYKSPSPEELRSALELLRELT